MSPSALVAAPSPARPPDPLTQLTRWLALGGTAALIALGLGWELWLAPTGSGTLALKVVPLLPALPGLWRYRLFTYRWLSLLLWLYVAEGLVRASTEAGLVRGLAVLEVMLSLLIFVACAWHVRWRLARARDTGHASGPER